MMKASKLTLTILLIVIFQKSNAQNDLQEFGYKGSVSKVIHKKYLKTNVKPGSQKSLNHKCIETTQVYNDNGNLEVLIWRNNILNAVDSIKKRVYHYENNIKSGWTDYESSDIVITEGVIKWRNHYSYSETGYDSLGKLISKSLIKLNKNLTLYKIISKYWANDTMAIAEESTFLRNGFGPAKSTITKNLISNVTYTVKYEVLAIDKVGNPTKTLVIIGGDTTLSVREYFYR